MQLNQKAVMNWNRTRLISVTEIIGNWRHKKTRELGIPFYLEQFAAIVFFVPNLVLRSCAEETTEPPMYKLQRKSHHLPIHLDFQSPKTLAQGESRPRSHAEKEIANTLARREGNREHARARRRKLRTRSRTKKEIVNPSDGEGREINEPSVLMEKEGESKSRRWTRDNENFSGGIMF